MLNIIRAHKTKRKQPSTSQPPRTFNKHKFADVEAFLPEIILVSLKLSKSILNIFKVDIP